MRTRSLVLVFAVCLIAATTLVAGQAYSTAEVNNSARLSVTEPALALVATPGFEVAGGEVVRTTNINVDQGSTATDDIEVKNNTSSNGLVALSILSSPADLTVTSAGPPASVSPDGTVDLSVTVEAAATASPGTYLISAVAEGEFGDMTAELDLVIPVTVLVPATSGNQAMGITTLGTPAPQAGPKVAPPADPGGDEGGEDDNTDGEEGTDDGDNGGDEGNDDNGTNDDDGTDDGGDDTEGTEDNGTNDGDNGDETDGDTGDDDNDGEAGTDDGDTTNGDDDSDGDDGTDDGDTSGGDDDATEDDNSNDDSDDSDDDDSDDTDDGDGEGDEDADDTDDDDGDDGGDG